MLYDNRLHIINTQPPLFMLAHFLTAQIFNFLLIFCRVGAGVMTLPGIGETYVSARIRVIFALLLTLIVLPFLSHLMPALPASGLMLFLLITNEIIIGLFISTVARILISATHVAGMIISLQAGISSAVIYDPNQSSQGSVIGNFLGIITVIVLFATDLHYLMLRGIVESYSVFAPGKLLPVADFTDTISHLVSDTFLVAIQIASPLLIIGTLLFLAAGIIGRLMPTLQVFAVLTAPQLLIGFFIFITCFSGMMLFYMEFYHERLVSILSYLK